MVTRQELVAINKSITVYIATTFEFVQKKKSQGQIFGEKKN